MRDSGKRRTAALALTSLLAVGGGCAADPDPRPSSGGEPQRQAPSPPVGSSASPGAGSPSYSPLPTPETEVVPAPDPTLEAELIAMADCDQGRCTEAQEQVSQQGREQRLREIIAEHGWPSWPLVGRRGENAAWLIAQHADLDPVFQRQALDLLRDAVARGVASPGNLAYLEDRVAVADGLPQTYGTQIRCTGADGGPEPATPIDDEAAVDSRRAEAGLEPLRSFLDEMAEICAGG